jgi:hypothetical protein
MTTTCNRFLVILWMQPVVCFMIPESISQCRLLLANRIVADTLRKTVYTELFDSGTVFKELSQSFYSQIDYFYYFTFSVAIVLLIKDGAYNKSIAKMRKNSDFRRFERRVEFLAIIVMMVLTKNIENAI